MVLWIATSPQTEDQGMADVSISDRKNRMRTAANDLYKVNMAFLKSPAYRRRALKALGTEVKTGPAWRIRDGEFERATPEARVFSNLTEGSLALAVLTTDHTVVPRLNLVFGEFDPSAIFAGVHTALLAGVGLAARLQLPVRLVVLSEGATDDLARRALAYLAETHPGTDFTVAIRRRLVDEVFSPDDHWVATHWTTAHALQAAVAAGRVSATRVAYVIQDYEPGFNAWSTHYDVARNTYHAGFVPIVNSGPLYTYLTREEGLEIDSALHFAPAFDTDRLRSVAAARRRRDTVRVLFYGRPSKPRNLYELGLAALKSAVVQLGDDVSRVEFLSAGEQHEPVDLGSGTQLTSVGKMAWDDYFDFLSTADVVLSLQGSPHPSHPPIESAVSGARAVTNDFAGTRGSLHPHLVVVSPEPVALGAALAEAIRETSASGPLPFTPVSDGVLGGELDDALDLAASLLKTSAP